jgi:two-component system chemotaxis response regulator CheB
MAVKVRNQKTFVQILDAPEVNRHKPSVDYLFKSVADLRFPNVVAAVLTGRGADGAEFVLPLGEIGSKLLQLCRGKKSKVA